MAQRGLWRRWGATPGERASMCARPQRAGYSSLMGLGRRASLSAARTHRAPRMLALPTRTPNLDSLS